MMTWLISFSLGDKYYGNDGLNFFVIYDLGNVVMEGDQNEGRFLVGPFIGAECR